MATAEIPDAWPKRVDSTQLGKKRLRGRLDRWVNRKLKLHQQAPNLVCTVEQSFENIKQLQNHWLACTTTIVLTGELLLGANDGLILSKAKERWNRHANEQAWIEVHTMNHLRNVLCHPANPPVIGLCDHIKRFEPEQRELAASLCQDWSILGQRIMAEYALDKLDAVVRHVVNRYHPS